MAPRRSGGGLSRRAALALIGGGGLLGISSTGAFDQVQGQRPFDLSVDDDDALLGIELFSPIEIDSSPATVDVLKLHNRFPEATFDSVSVTTSGSLLSFEEPLAMGETVEPNERLTVRGTVSTDRSLTRDVEVTITVSGGSERVETTREVRVIAELAGQQPDACPVSPNVSVTVGGNASDGRVEDGDLTLENEDIDGDVETADGSEGEIDITNTTITGDVIADDDVNLSNTDVGGDVRTKAGSEGDISLSNVTIGGDIVADGEIGGGDDDDGGVKNTTVAGSVETRSGSEGDIEINATGNGGLIGGSIIADGDISIQNGAVGGDIETRSGSEGEIDLQKTVICGSVTSDSEIDTGTDSEIGGDLTTRAGSEGDITIGNNTTVYGSVAGDGDVTVSGTVNGDVTTRTGSEGDVTVNGTVNGGVFADGDVDGTGTINGNDPRPSSGSEDDDDDDDD